MTTMVITRRFFIVLSILIASVNLQAQWLTKADEGPSARQVHAPQMHKFKATHDGERDERGVGDAFKWYWRQRTFGLGYIPEGAYQKALNKRDAMLRGSGMTTLSTAPAWTLVGPNNIGGRVNAIAINPYNPNTVFIGAANGGVWKTTDAGNTFIPLTDQMQSVSMGSLAIDPNDTNIIFAGTGELPGTLDSYAGYGMLRSTDGGKTWSDVGPSSVAAYSQVIVNPHHSNLVYAAAGRSGGGVLISTDGGNTWNWTSPQSGLPQNQSVSDLALSMNGDTAVLYAGVVGNGVYQSTDGGNTWAILSNLSFALDPGPTPVMTRLSIDVDDSNWQNVVVLDVNGGSDDDFGGLEVSNDGGNTWNDAGTQFESSPSPLAEPNFAAPAQGWYDVYIRVDPSNFNHMLMGGVGMSNTQDGGNSWSEVDYESIHVDHHAAAFAPSDPTQVYVGSDGGCFYSPDGGSDYNGGTFLLPITQFYGIGIDQTQANATYGGTQDNGSLSGASGTLTWQPILGGDGTMVQVDPKTPSLVYCETPDSPPSAYGGSITDNGLNPSIDSTTWINPFAADATNDYVYWGCQRLAITKNQGKSWTNFNQVFGSASGGTSISTIATFGDGKHVLVGTGGGLVYLTSNNGTSFTNVSSNLPVRSVSCVLFNPTSPSIFYAVLSGFGAGHVFETTNSGSSWTDLSTTLPDIPVNSICMDPQNSNVLYIGTDVGVFFSPNNGVEWMPYGTGLPNTGIDFMEIQVTNRVLRAGTHGRSVWQVPLQDDQQGIVRPAQRTVWTLGDTASIQWHGFSSTVTLALSLDGGSSWQNIATVSGDSVYPISNVEFPQTENAIVRVSDEATTLLSPLFSIAQQLAGQQIATVGELPLYLYDIAYDKDDNVLWGTNFNPSEDYIYKIDPDAGTILDSVKIAVNNAPNRQGFTGIKYDPITKNLFLHQVNGTADGNWNSYIYEVSTTGVVDTIVPSPALYGTGIYVKGDTILAVDRMIEHVYRALLSDWNFNGNLSYFDYTDTRDATYGGRGLTYDPNFDEYLLAFTDFQGTNLEGSYMLFLDSAFGQEQNAFNIEVGSELTNVRGMEWDPRGAGNTAWMTVLTSGGSAQLIKIALANGPSGAPSASLILDPPTVAFGNLDTGKTSTIHAEIINTGNAPAVITAISIVPTGSEFSLGTLSLPDTLPAGDSMEVSVTFTSNAPGPQSASLSVTFGADAQEAFFEISGFGTINGAGVTANGSSNDWNLELYPNPARDFVDVTLDAPAPDVAQIHIYDVTGREVLTAPLGMLSPGEHETELSTVGIPDGIYFVRVLGSSGQVASARLSIVR
jgi:photosystem II stability/assembly factor-like uncharacterized protein